MLVGDSGALIEKVNKAPEFMLISADREKPPAVNVVAKSPETADDNTDPDLTVMLQEIRSPILTTSLGAVHVRIEVVVGLPYTAIANGLFDNGAKLPPRDSCDITCMTGVEATGALRVKVNEAPPVNAVRPENDVPPSKETEKSDATPVVGELPERVLIVHLSWSFTRIIGFPTPAQESDDDVVGRPNTTSV